MHYNFGAQKWYAVQCHSICCVRHSFLDFGAFTYWNIDVYSLFLLMLSMIMIIFFLTSVQHNFTLSQYLWRQKANTIFQASIKLNISWTPCNCDIVGKVETKVGSNPVVVSAGRCPAQSDTVRQQWGDHGQAVPLLPSVHTHNQSSNNHQCRDPENNVFKKH